MASESDSVGVRRIVPVPDAEATGARPDYTDAFEVRRPSPDPRPAEAWAREVFEGAPRAVGWFLLTGWRVVLGLRPGPRGSSDHVLGWRIVSRHDKAVVLAMTSPIMTAGLVLTLSETEVVLMTKVHYSGRMACPLWTMVGPIHRRAIPYLLRRAAPSR